MVKFNMVPNGTASLAADAPFKWFLDAEKLLPQASMVTPSNSPKLFVRSPFRAKHHVVVQYMARWMKCPLPP